MRIGFDASPTRAGWASPGVERATRGLLAALRARSAECGIEWVALTPPAGSRPRTWRQWVVPKTVRREMLAGFHSMVSAVPLLGDFPVVQSVYELPWRHGVAEGSRATSRWWVRAGVRRASAVLLPSERTAADHLAQIGDRGLLRWVAEPGLGPALLAGELAPRPRNPVRLVMPGGARPKKNADLLVRALARPGNADLELLITGPKTPDTQGIWQIARDLGVADRLLHREHVEPDGWQDEIDNCLAVCAIADSEGYGFAPLEALARGRPAIVSRAVPSVRAAGGLVHAINAHSAVELDAALANCRQPSAGHACAARAFAAQHTTAHCAVSVERLWLQLLGRRP